MQPQKKQLLIVAVILLFATMQYSLWFGPTGWLPVWDTEAHIRQQQQHLETINAQIKTLQERLDALKEPHTIEALARKKLGYINADQNIVIVTSTRQ